MVKESEYTIKPFYQGGYSTFSPTGYSGNIKTRDFGLTTDPRNANLIKEISEKLSSGVKNIEVELISPQVVDSIPKQHFEEAKRLSELTGIDISVHGPVVDVAGITQQGWSEVNREASEVRVIDTLTKANEIKPGKNINVTFHSAEGIPGTEFETLDGERKAKRIIAIDRETGKSITAIEKEEKFYPWTDHAKDSELIRKENYTPEENIEMTNATQWDNGITQLIMHQERADEILRQNEPYIRHLLEGIDKGELKWTNLPPQQQEIFRHIQNARAYTEDIHKQLNGMFSKAYKYGNEDQRKILTKLSENFKKQMEIDNSPFGESRAINNFLMELKHPALAPEVFVPIEKFAIEQSSKTFGNAAFEAYKKYGTGAPIISIENPPVGFALSTGEDLKNLVEASRNEFVQNAVASKKLSESEAKKVAEKLIGATWDVGHINMLKKQGFEDKDIISESKKIAPYLKHVHFSDNFGLEHTELPMGMGNVPLKEIMEKLGQKGFEAKKIIEASGWWQHFRSSPVRETFEYIGSPIYSEGVAPYWNQNIGFQQGYGGDMGIYLPQINYQTFGGGFSQLPIELGGQRPGAQGGRMGGGGME